MQLSMATMLGLTRLDNPEYQDRVITLGCWANTRSVGTMSGVRDASPGFLQILPPNTAKKVNIEDSDFAETILQSQNKYVVFPFSIINGGKPRIKLSVPGDVGIIIDSFTPVTWPYETKTTVFDKINDVDFEWVMHTLYSTGPVSLVIKSNNNLIFGLCNIIKDIDKVFNHSDVLYYNINKPSVKDLTKFGDAEFRMTFIKPNQGLPFFGKNNGGIMHFTIIQPGAVFFTQKVYPLIEVVLLFTDNTSAFKNVDGSGNIYGSSFSVDKLSKILKECTFAFETVNGKEIVAR